MEAIFEEAKKPVNQHDIEVFNESWAEDTVEFEMGKLKSIESRQVDGYSVRLIKEGRIGFSGGTRFDPEDIVKRALGSSKFGPEARFQFPDDSPEGNPRIFDPAIEKMALEDMAQKGTEILEYMSSQREGVQCDVVLERFVGGRRILTSKFDKSYRKTLYSFSLVAHLFREGDFLHIYDAFSGSQLQTLERRAADRILTMLEWAGKEASVSTGEMPVIFSPRGFKEIFRSLLINLNGRTVEKGAGIMGDRMNQVILPEAVTVTDDGTIDGHAQAAPFDDEGLPVKKKYLVKEGVLRSFVLDLQSAGTLGLPPTGNAYRRYSSLPRPAIHTVVFSPGKESREALFSGIKEGLYVDQLIGAHTGNPFSGDFQLNVDLGFKIENSQIAGRVKNVMISGNLYKLFDYLAGFTEERDWEESYLLPHIRFDKVTVSGK